MDTKDPVILGRGKEILYYTKSLLQLCKEKQEKIDASVLVDDVLPAIGKGIQAVDELTGGRLSTVLSAIDPVAWGTGVRRGLRDGFGASQRIAQNAGDFVQYSGELALLCCTFGSGTAVKGAKVATAATRSVKVAETAAVAKKTKRLAQLDKMVAENVTAKAEGIGPYKYVKGHHPLQKAAFDGHPMYNFREVLAVSEERLTKYGIRHEWITKEQRALQKELRYSGKPNTMAEQVRISWQAMEKAGVPRAEARNITAQAFWDLRIRGVNQPVKMPKK